MDQLRSLLDSLVAEGLMDVNDMGYYYPLEVSKKLSSRLTAVLWSVFERVRDVEAVDVSVTVTDRFGRPMWKLPEANSGGEGNRDENRG
jgi:hypothetical protein